MDRQFDIGNFCLRAKQWGDPRGMPVLALHGWLDNCATFDFLAPLLPQLNLICLDLAGHGLSDHRNHRGAYNIWQDVGEVFAVADQLGWREFGLLGHSRGAIIAMLAAGTFPERISHLAMIEGICPQVEAPENSPETLSSSILKINQQVSRSRRAYRLFEEAVAAREKGLFALCHTDALALAERGVIEGEEGFSWCYDSKLLGGSELRLSAEQVEAFVRRITAPKQLVLAKEGILTQFFQLANWLKDHDEIPQAQVPGYHHCHMSEQAERVADALSPLYGAL